MGNRVDTIFSRLQALIPPPDATGWHFTRLQLEAAAMGSSTFTTSNQDQQAALAEQQLNLGALLVRTDASPTTWDTTKAAQWRLDPTLSAGAGSFFLDVWGRSLAVGRMAGEVDTAYARRIITSVSRSTATNLGLAQAIDTALGISGTRVIDASSVLQVLRMNSGYRLNSGKRLNAAGTAKSLWCCFVVQTAAQISDADYQKFLDLVNGRKAAGTRLLGIMVGATLAPLISSPGVVPQSATFTANAMGLGAGVTAYNWSVTGGTIVAGAGTSSVSIQAGTGSVLSIQLSVVQNGATSPSSTRDVLLVDAGIVTSVPTDPYVYAGDGIFTATAPNGLGYAWSMTGGYLMGSTMKRTVSFTVGEANQLATLTCAFLDGASMQKQLKVVPYTSAANASTGALATNQTQNVDVNLGWAYELVSVQVDRPCWVRIYNTAAARTSDASRTVTTDPPKTLTDLVWEGIFSSSLLTIFDKPDTKGVNGDNPRTQAAYLAITNLDATTASVNVTIMRTETTTSGIF